VKILFANLKHALASFLTSPLAGLLLKIM